MLKINGLEKLSEEEIKNIDINILELFINMLEGLTPVNRLGDTINISDVKSCDILDENVDDTFEFSLDNGYKLERIIYYKKYGDLLVEIDDDLEAYIYAYDIETEGLKYRNHFYKKGDIKVIDTSRNEDYNFKVLIENQMDIILINFKDKNFNKLEFIRELLNGKHDQEFLKSVLPKDDLTIKYRGIGNEYVISYKDNKLISEEEREIDYGKER